MPLREYFCEGCQKKFEIIHKTYEDRLTTCPECGKNVKLLLSTCALKFIGSGFYSVDYKDNKKDDIKTKQKKD